MRSRWIPWNTASTFALAGYALIAVMLGADPRSGFSSWTQAAIVAGALTAAYATSTWLGAMAARKARYLETCLIVGVAIALSTLLSGVLSAGIVSLFLSWLSDVLSARWGLPYFSMGIAIREHLLVPAWWVMLLGGWIAAIFGLVYGTVLYLSVRRLPPDD